MTECVCVCRLSRFARPKNICGHFIFIFTQKENILFICEKKLLSRSPTGGNSDFS